MKGLEKRQNIINTFFIIAGLLLTFKIAQLQLFSSQYKEQAQRTTLDKKTLYPSRGLIYDREGKLLVTNNPIYDINCIYNNVDMEMDTALFCKLLDIDNETFNKNLNKNWSSVRFHKSIPFTFLSRVKPEQYAVFQEHLYAFPGFYPVLRNIRAYPHKNAAHVLGYLGEVDKKTIEESDGQYEPGDFIGVSGIEKTYENHLRGSKGTSYVLKDNLGRDVGAFDDGSLNSSAISGQDIITSLDLDLQQYGEFLMQNKRGSIVAIEPATGEVLTMLSSPAYDPNILNLDRDRGEAYSDLLYDTLNRPFMDRSVMSRYPPGSIFKPILSLIAMQEGVLDSNRTIYCDGEYEVDSKGLYKQKCHKHPTPYNVTIALQHSCNSYYFQVIREVINKFGYSNPGAGLDTLMNYVQDFGLGHKLGLDYLYENPGFIPSSSFYDQLYANEMFGWRSTYILSLGIGQGEFELTTLQMANMAAILANRGHYITPHLVKGYGDESSIEDIDRERHDMRIDPQYYEPVIEGMERVISAGTATSAAVPGIRVCGKTGTSENKGKDHSVFFAFAPRENPKIAIAIYVENAGFGGAIAGPIASLMIEKYLKGDIADNRKYLEDYLISKNLLKLP